MKRFLTLVFLSLALLVAAPVAQFADTGAFAQTKKETKKALLAALPAETEYCVVRLGEKSFTDADGFPDPLVLSAQLTIACNGALTAPNGTVGQQITYPVDRTRSQVQTLIRSAVNAYIAQYEPGNTLNNAHILLEGLSD